MHRPRALWPNLTMLPRQAPVFILLIDDHPLLRSGVRMVVEAGLPHAVVREAGSLLEAIQGDGGVPPIPPDLVLLDIEMPGLNGLDGLARLNREWAGVPVVMLSSHTEAETVRSALALGAVAFISKAQPAHEIVAVLVKVIAEGTSIGGAAGQRPVNGDAAGRLTARQAEVLELVCQGLSNKAIGKRLDLSEHTVRGHVQAVLAFLRVSSRSEAGFAARRDGLVR